MAAEGELQAVCSDTKGSDFIIVADQVRLFRIEHHPTQLVSSILSLSLSLPPCLWVAEPVHVRVRVRVRFGVISVVRFGVISVVRSGSGLAVRDISHRDISHREISHRDISHCRP